MNIAALALPLALALGLAACNNEPEVPPSPPIENEGAMPEAQATMAPAPGMPDASQTAPETPAPSPTPDAADERPGAYLYGGEAEGAPTPPA